MSITIVIPTYNRADLLRRALRSIARQQQKPDQVIISDNASTDHTAEVVKEFLKIGMDIRYTKHSTNIGMLKNWQSGISLVETEYFLVLADDDYLLPNCIKTGVSAFHDNPHLGMWCGVTVCVDRDLKPISLAPSNLETIGKLFHFDLLTHILQHPASTGSIFSKGILDRVGGFRVESEYLADLSMMLRISAVSEVALVREPVAIYSASATYSKRQFFDSWYPGCLDIFDQLQKLGVKDKLSYKKYLGRTLYFSCSQLMKDFFNNNGLLKSNMKIFSGLFKYITPLPVLLAFVEGPRLQIHGLKSKYNRSKFIDYCQLYRIDQNIKEANL
jgi:glycosyltransferase involved in cell wall biosynthesis